MTKWNLSVSEEADRTVRGFLAERGLKKGGLSDFVVKAAVREVMRQTVAEIQAANADLSADEAMKLANDAVTWARAQNRP